MARKQKAMSLAEIFEQIATIGGAGNSDQDQAIRKVIRDGRSLPELDQIAAALLAQPVGSVPGLLLTRLARDEHAESKQARLDGKAIPPMPFLDALTRRNQEMTTTKANGGAAPASTSSGKGGGGTRTAKAAAVHFTHDGKLVSPTQNKLSSVAWFYTKPLGKGGGRMKVGELKALLTELGVANPFEAGWSVKLPNGVTLGAVKSGETPKPIEKQATLATGSTAKKPAKSTAKKSTAKKQPAKKAPAAKKSSVAKTTAKQSGIASVASLMPKLARGKGATAAPSKLAPDKRPRKATAKS